MDQPINILIVDDEPKNLTVLETILDDPAYRLVRAESANQALLALVVEEFALLILDIRMPGMTGFELAQIIKERKKTARVPIIFLTAYYNEDQHVLAGYDTGAVDYLHKPVNAAILRSKVAVFAELYRKSREVDQANRALCAEVTERRRGEEQLRALNETLGQRVAERTEALRKNEGKFRALLEAAPDAMVIADREDVILLVNVQTERLFGYGREEMLGQPVECLIPARSGDRPLAHRDGVFATPYTRTMEAGRELLGRRKDGSEFPIEISLSPIETEGGTLVSSAIRDVSERKQAEAALLLTNERFELAVKCAQVALFQQDLELRYTWLHNPASGFEADAVGSRDGDLMERAEDAAQVEALKREVIRSGVGQRQEVVVYIHGVDRHFDLLVEPLRDAAGLISGVTCAAIDITERQRAEETLRDNAVILADLDRRKDAFLATLSHELRNPLGVIGSSLHLLRLTGQDRDAVQQGCARMERQVVVLTRLIDDLMDVSRINQDKLTLRTERLDLATVAQSALENSRTVLDQRGHTVTVVLPPQPIEVDGDATRLAQVVSNLLTNAAKYSDPGSPIGLTVERQGDVAAVAVRDRGIGIAPADLRRVFEAFAQVSGAAHLAQGGLGIGLNLVKRVVELHGGSVEARSDGLGHGSEFLVRLPLASSEALSERPPDRNVLSPSPFRRYRILVADDNEDAVTTLALLLRHLGHDVRTAENGAQAVAVAAIFQPEVALLDVGMPELDGHEACRRIRAQPGGDTMVLVAVSGWGQDEDKRRARNAGFQHHLVKPVDPAALTALLHALAPA